MDISSISLLDSSHYSSFPLKKDRSDRDFKSDRDVKKADNSPLPPRLNDRLPFPETPWKINEDLFKRLQFPATSTTEKYHKIQLVQSDPETEFVYLLFNHSRPKNLHIARVYCIHNPSLTRAFESNLEILEKQALNPAFAPNLDSETDSLLRKRTLERWQSAANLFSPLQLETTSRKIENLTHTYILPLWHGTSQKICESIAGTGFTYFGKHSFKQDKGGDEVSTDIGYFGSGIYFTNSARYCSKTYGKEHMVLAWVAMRQPFPVVADHSAISADDEPKDKTMLKGKGAYKNYNAHYIPVLKIRTPDKPTVHYPCADGQQPLYDEIVVFKEQQALPRFLIELAVDLPISPSSSSSSSSSSAPSSFSSSLSPSPTLESLLNKLYEVLENPALKQDHNDLYVALTSYARDLVIEDPRKPLSSEYFSLYNTLSKLLDQNGKVRRIVEQSLLLAKGAKINNENTKRESTNKSADEQRTWYMDRSLSLFTTATAGFFTAMIIMVFANVILKTFNRTS